MARPPGRAGVGQDADILPGVARQAIGGARQRRLVGDLGRQHVDHAPAEDDDRAVADELHLLQLGRVEQHRLALRRRARAAAGRFRAWCRHRCRASDRSTGWCAHPPRSSARSSPSAGCRRTAAAPRAARACRSAAARWPRRPPSVSRAMSMRSPVAQARAEGQGDVLAHRALHEQRLGAVARDIGDAGLDGIGRMPELNRLAVDLDRAAGGPDRRRTGRRTARPAPGPRAPRRRRPRRCARSKETS